MLSKFFIVTFVTTVIINTILIWMTKISILIARLFSDMPNWYKSIYQTAHRFNGFSKLPAGHLNALLNSSKFDRTPITRKISGLCSSVSTCCSAAASFLCPHQNCKFINIQECIWSVWCVLSQLYVIADVLTVWYYELDTLKFNHSSYQFAKRFEVINVIISCLPQTWANKPILAVSTFFRFSDLSLSFAIEDVCYAETFCNLIQTLALKEFWTQSRILKYLRHDVLDGLVYWLTWAYERKKTWSLEKFWNPGSLGSSLPICWMYIR